MWQVVFREEVVSHSFFQKRSVCLDTTSIDSNMLGELLSSKKVVVVGIQILTKGHSQKVPVKGRQTGVPRLALCF